LLQVMADIMGQLFHLKMTAHPKVVCQLVLWLYLLQVMADIMGAEAALVRIQFMSGTHAIAAGLFAALRPGDEMLAVAGK
jgi:hypothetical protein